MTTCTTGVRDGMRIEMNEQGIYEWVPPCGYRGCAVPDPHDHLGPNVTVLSGGLWVNAGPVSS